METKRARLVQEIREQIESGMLPLNSENKLPTEREMAVHFDVSRLLLREALLTLEGMNYLTIKKRNGVFLNRSDFSVLTQSLKNISLWPSDLFLKVMEIRMVLEVPAAKFAGLRRTERHLKQMDECLERLAKCGHKTAEENHEGAYWDALLHGTVVQAADNEMLTRIYEGITQFMKQFHASNRSSLFNGIPGWREKSDREHEEIVARIREKNAVRAAGAMCNHLQTSLLGHEKLLNKK